MLDALGEALGCDLPLLFAAVWGLLRSQWADYADYLDENGPNGADAASSFAHRVLQTARRGLARGSDRAGVCSINQSRRHIDTGFAYVGI